MGAGCGDQPGYERSRRIRAQSTIARDDGLKQVNDEQGHAAGDDLLRSVVRCVSEQLRPYDLIARFGGDEFVCSLSGDGLAGIRERFEQIGDRLRDVMPGATISVGLCQSDATDDVETLIGRADAAMIASRCTA